MNKIILIFTVLSITFCAPVSADKALEVAGNIFVQYHDSHNINNFVISESVQIPSDAGTLIYLYHLDPIGFILISGHDSAMPCLGFGFDANFILDGMPGNISGLFNSFKTDIREMLDNDTPQRQDIRELWNRFTSNEFNYTRERNVSPLIDAEFNQSGGWNNGVTSGIGFNGPVGCVSVAMCQVMHYWNHPYVGESSHSYNEDDYGLISISFEDSYYDFDNMAATYATGPSQLLLFHAGVSVNMDYDFSGSGAYVVGGYPSSEYALQTFFKYSNNISHVYKQFFSDTEYRNILKEELDNNRPIIARGFDNSDYGGHAWNIDGYNGNNLHCNWGWGGASNGYYNVTSMGGFPDDQAALIGIIPNTIESPMALFDYYTDISTVYFIDLSSEINVDEIRNWHWNFGDGTIQTTDTGEVSYTFQSSGIYLVELVVENLYGMLSEPFFENIEVSVGMIGDINQDLYTDVLDIVLLVNFILGDIPTNSEFFAADLNSDGIINVQDIVLLISIVISD